MRLPVPILATGIIVLSQSGLLPERAEDIALAVSTLILVVWAIFVAPQQVPAIIRWLRFRPIRRWAQAKVSIEGEWNTSKQISNGNFPPFIGYEQLSIRFRSSVSLQQVHFSLVHSHGGHVNAYMHRLWRVGLTALEAAKDSEQAEISYAVQGKHFSRCSQLQVFTQFRLRDSFNGLLKCQFEFSPDQYWRNRTVLIPISIRQSILNTVIPEERRP